MNIPAELKYTEDHEWVKVDGDVATIGITDFAQGELGDIVYVEVETEGETMDANEVFGTVEAVKTVSDLPAFALRRDVEQCKHGHYLYPFFLVCCLNRNLH